MLYVFFVSFFTTVLSLYFLSKTKNSESIKDFLPDNHQSKKSISRRGGIAIGVIGSLLTLYLNKFIFIISFLSFILGLIDDVCKKRKGLPIIVRVFCWIVFGILLGLYKYYFLGNGKVLLPFFGFIDLGFYYIIFVTIFFLNVINSVNMTDGLDGLVSFPLITNLFFLGFVSFLTNKLAILWVVLGLTGMLLGFLFFNIHPAKIFMGDSGSIFLGSIISILYALLSLEFFYPIVAFIFTINTTSSLLQIFTIIILNKKIFKMAPLHHHFELSGYKETTIVFYSWLISIFTTFIGICIYLNTL